MKLDCQMEVNGITEIVLFRQLKFVRGVGFVGNVGRRHWAKYVYVPSTRSWRHVDYMADYKVMKKVKSLAKRANIHVWVSETTLNMVRRE